MCRQGGWNKQVSQRQEALVDVFHHTPTAEDCTHQDMAVNITMEGLVPGDEVAQVATGQKQRAEILGVHEAEDVVDDLGGKLS
jgi:hypothetical protein